MMIVAKEENGWELVVMTKHNKKEKRKFQKNWEMYGRLYKFVYALLRLQ